MLLVRSGSEVVEDTDTVFVKDPAWAGAVTTTVIVSGGDPAAHNGRVHVTDTFPAFEHDHAPPADTETNDTPAGNVSVTDTATASDGPALATVRS